MGLSGAAIAHREGFKELLTRVTLGEVGIILSAEVQRLSRHCSAWYPRLDLGGYQQCLIAARDGVYDPGTPNGRLLLGLKGQLSELELHPIRARLTAGILNKAQRGEFALQLPVGLMREPEGRVQKDPNREGQQRLELVFGTLLQVRSTNKVLRVFNDQQLLLPRRARFGDVVWKKPTVSALLAGLKNPAYAGSFVYGRTRPIRPGAGPRQASQKKLPITEWRIRVPDKYPAYISGETYERIQALIQDNYAAYDRNKTRGVPRPGAALLPGLLYWRECGHKLVVQDKAGTRYLCNYLRQHYGVPVCQYLPADPVAATVVAAFFAVLAPRELGLYQQAVAAQHQTTERLTRAHAQQLERLRYQAALAQRQVERGDPNTRLVAAELEPRGEAARPDLKQAAAAAEQQQTSQRGLPSLPPDLQAAFPALGQKRPELWETSVLSRVQQKALLRCLLDKGVVHRTARDQVRLRIVWRGGDTTTAELPIPVGSLAELSTGPELAARILALPAAGKSAQEIAAALTAAGFRSPSQAQTLLVSTVRRIRLKPKLFVTHSQSPSRPIPGCLTVPQLAQALHLSVHWVYDRIHNGTIQRQKDPTTRLYLVPDHPTTLEQLRQLRDGQLQHLGY